MDVSAIPLAHSDSVGAAIAPILGLLAYMSATGRVWVTRPDIEQALRRLPHIASPHNAAPVLQVLCRRRLLSMRSDEAGRLSYRLTS